jgi:RNA polymerase sigma factor (TIGR02999 family)
MLRAWSQGDEGALEKLTPLVYQHLHRVAHSYMRQELRGHTLQTTALINEAYVRLVDVGRVTWQNRAHFFAMCARLMRQILTDFARSRLSVRRGAEAQHLSLDESLTISGEPRPDLVALDEALNRLAGIDARKSQVVELRFFGGLSVEETAEVLKASPETVKRDWRLARSWLLRELSPVAKK